MTQTIIRREYETNLPCTLTKKERLTRADKLGEQAKEVQHSRSEKNAAAKRLKAAEAAFEQLSEVVSSGVEYRDVTVQVTLNFDTGIALHTRTDTGEVIIEQPMTYDERQAALPMAGTKEQSNG